MGNLKSPTIAEHAHLIGVLENVRRQRDEFRARAEESKAFYDDEQKQLTAMRRERDELAAALESEVVAEKLHTAWGRYTELLGEPPHGTMKQLLALLEFAHLADGAKSILAAYDAAKDAEIDALSAGLRLAHDQMRKQQIPEVMIDKSVGLDACKRALDALVKPLVEALTKAPCKCRCLTHGYGCNIRIRPADTCRQDATTICYRCAALAPYRPRSGTIEVTLEGGERAKPFPERCPTCDDSKRVFDDPSAPCPDCAGGKKE